MHYNLDDRKVIVIFTFNAKHIVLLEEANIPTVLYSGDFLLSTFT